MNDYTLPPLTRVICHTTNNVANPDHNPIPFALSPALSVTGFINYSTAEGRKHFERSMSKLSDDYFECETDNLHMFLDSLAERAIEMGWEIPGVGITDVLLDPTNPNSDYINVLTNHGELTLEQIQAFEATYIHLPTRAAQDTYALQRCICNSASKSVMKKVGL